MGGFETKDWATKNSMAKCLGKVTDYRWLLRKGVEEKKRCLYSCWIILMWLSVSFTFRSRNSSHFLWMFWLLISGPFSLLILNSIWLIQIQGTLLLKSFTIPWFHRRGLLIVWGFVSEERRKLPFTLIPFILDWHNTLQASQTALLQVSDLGDSLSVTAHRTQVSHQRCSDAHLRCLTWTIKLITREMIRQSRFA